MNQKEESFQISKQEKQQLLNYESNNKDLFQKMKSNPQILKPNSVVITHDKNEEEKNFKKRVSFADENYNLRLAEVQLVESYKEYNFMKQGMCGCFMM